MAPELTGPVEGGGFLELDEKTRPPTARLTGYSQKYGAEPNMMRSAFVGPIVTKFRALDMEVQGEWA